MPNEGMSPLGAEQRPALLNWRGKAKFRTTEACGWNTRVRMTERHTESGACCEVSVTLKVRPQLMTRRSWEDSVLVQQLSAATVTITSKLAA